VGESIKLSVWSNGDQKDVAVTLTEAGQ